MRPEEVPTALLMALYFFLAMTCISIVKSLQNALYLGNVGFDWRLPLLYVALAVLSGPLVVFYRRLGTRYSNFWLNSHTLLFFFLTVGLFWQLIPVGQSWVYLAFYIWGGIFSVLLPTQGWMFSNDLYTTREAKRLFAILGTGGIFGGAFGGYYTALVAGVLGTRWLLIHVCILLLSIQAVLFFIYRRNRSRLRQRHPHHFMGRPSSGSTLQSIYKLFQSRYLLYLAGLVLIASFTGTLIDLQYKWVLDQRYPPGSDIGLTEFFGALLGTIFVFSALFQLFATSHILHRLGIRFGLLILPLGLLAGSLGVVTAAAFWTVVSLKAIDGTLRSSIDRTSVELLYMPASSHEAVAMKSFFNLVVFRFGDALAATIFLGASALNLAPLQAIGVVVLIAAALWAFLSMRLSDEYVRTLRRSLDIKPTAASRRAFQLGEAAAERTLLAALHSLNPTKVQFALQQLIQTGSEAEAPVEDFTNAGEEMLQTQMSGIEHAGTPEWLESVAPLVDHPDMGVGAAAFHLMVRYRPTKSLGQLRESLSSERIPKILYLFYLDRYVKQPGKFLSERCVLGWCRDATAQQALLLARLMGNTKNRSYLEVLSKWMNGPRGESTRAAIEAIGQYADLRFVEVLVKHLGVNWTRQAARKALICYGDSVVSQLIELLRNPGVDVSIKREIPPILGQIGTESSRAGLVTSLYLPDSVVSFKALKALNKIRDLQTLSYLPNSFFPLLQIWAKEYYQLVNTHLLVGSEEDSAWNLLRKVVKERMDWSIEKIFRGLGLFLPYGDAYFSYVGYTSDQQELRENAVELIDSQIKGELRQTLLPIFAEPGLLEVARKGRALFGLSSDRDKILAEALFQSDPWMKCCTIAAIAARRILPLRSSVEQACQDINPMVRETAQCALAGWQEAASFGTSYDD
jgi:AAA family ATP:ADP antiporter